MRTKEAEVQPEFEDKTPSFERRKSTHTEDEIAEDWRRQLAARGIMPVE